MTQQSSEERFWSHVDKNGNCWLWTAPTHEGYGYLWWIDRTDGAHRVSYRLAHGDIPVGMMIDHICHNRACVNPEHLRVVTNKQNCENRAGAQSNSRSGVRGVFWSPIYKKWVASVVSHGKRYYAGSFSNLRDAETAVIAKRNELFTHNIEHQTA